MRARLLIAALAAMAATAATAAEPAKPPVRKADQPSGQSAPVVVAAAEDARTPAASEPAATPVKRERKARVTTCRCGDQSAGQ